MNPKPPAKSAPARRSRGSLSEEEIVAGAIALAKRDGLGGLSMPNLARHLGAGVMSLYWYFHSKDDLIGAMAEHATKELYAHLPPIGDGPWDEEITRAMAAMRAEMRRTPLFAELTAARPRFVFSRPTVMPYLAGRVDAEVQVLMSLGLTAVDAMRLHNILSSYLLGFALMQIGSEPKGKDVSAEQALGAAVALLDPEEFPTLHAVQDVGALISLRDGDFDDFLDLLVQGIAVQQNAR